MENLLSVNLTEWGCIEKLLLSSYFCDFCIIMGIWGLQCLAAEQAGQVIVKFPLRTGLGHGPSYWKNFRPRRGKNHNLKKCSNL